MEPTLLIIAYMLATSLMGNSQVEQDCLKLGEMTKEMTQFVGMTCYVKRTDKWIPAIKATYPP